MAKIWKPVPGYPGLLASNDGMIVLPPGRAPTYHGGYRVYDPKPTFGVVRRANKTAKHSYRGVYSRVFGNIKVHRAVCLAFHGEPPSPKHVVIHINENAHDNRAENLKWGTQKENLNMPLARHNANHNRQNRKVLELIET